MDTTAFEYFMGIASGQTFWDVSENCNVSQSSVSKSISRLESDLGAKLFNRERRKVSLTPAGEIFYEFLLRTVPEYKKTLQRMAEHSALRKVICCAVPSNEILNLNYRVRNSDFAALHPDISLSLTRESSPEKAMQDLLSGEIDFIIEHRFNDIGEDIESVPLCPDPLFVLLPREHRFAARKSIDFMELYEEPVLVRSPTVHRILSNICSYWKRADLPNLIFFDVPSSQLRRNQLIDMVAFGEGISFFFASDLFPFRLEQVAMCPVTGIPDFPLVMLKKKGQIQPSYLKLAEEFLISVVPSEGPVLPSPG